MKTIYCNGSRWKNLFTAKAYSISGCMYIPRELAYAASAFQNTFRQETLWFRRSQRRGVRLARR